MSASILFFDDNRDNVKDMENITGGGNSHWVVRTGKFFGMNTKEFDIVTNFCNDTAIATPKILIFDWDKTLSVQSGFNAEETFIEMFGDDERITQLQNMFGNIENLNTINKRIHVFVLTANKNCNIQQGRDFVVANMKHIGCKSFEDKNLICSYLKLKSNALVRTKEFTDLIGKLPKTGDNYQKSFSIGELENKEPSAGELENKEPSAGGKKRKTKSKIRTTKRTTKKKKNQRRRPHA